MDSYVISFNPISFRPESNRYPHTAALQKVEAYNSLFDSNEHFFNQWISDKTVGGGCGGHCVRPATQNGTTWQMECLAWRLNKKAAGIPGAVYGTKIASIERPCDVNCSANRDAYAHGGQRCSGLVRVDLF